MKSDLLGPVAVVATVVLTLALMAIVFQYGDKPFQEHSAELAQGWAWEATDGDASSGLALFTANCASCHQDDGRGKVGLAPSIRNRDFLAIASDGFIRSTIRNGRAGTAMVPRRDLDDRGISDIIAYLRALPVANPVAITVDPTRVIPGDYDAGYHLYHDYCASCHGRNGEGYASGGSGPGIGLAGFLEAANDDYIFQTLKQGRVGTPMMPFLGARGVANLTEGEVGDIIAFLRANSTMPRTGGAAGSSGPPDPGKGVALFAANCVPCHQEGGVGKAGLAPSIRNRDFLAIASDEFIKATVAMGRPGTAMVPRPDLAESIDHIIAYLRSLPVANPVDLSLDPEWKAAGHVEAGESKFATYCASCHGPSGAGYSAGGSGPGIGLAGFLNVATDDYILQTVKRGRVGTAMMPFMGAAGLANLEQSDVEDIIAFLRSQDLQSQNIQ